MLDAVVGAVIMVVASTSLFLAVEVAEDAFTSSGRYSVNSDESRLLGDLGQSLLDKHRKSGDGQMSEQIESGLDLIDNFEKRVIELMPRQYQAIDGI